jgi:DNA-binding MarR family transcriptional regulator
MRSTQTTESRRGVRQQQTRLTPSQVARLVEERAAGATIGELAERFAVHRTTVTAHLRRRNT